MSVILLSLTFFGCVNPEYNLENVEIPDITVPLGNSKKVHLSKIFETSVIDGFLRVDEKTNDYYLVLSEGKFSPSLDLFSLPKTKAIKLGTYIDVMSLENFADALEGENFRLDMNSLRLDIAFNTTFPKELTVSPSLVYNDNTLALGMLDIPAWDEMNSKTHFSFSETGHSANTVSTPMVVEGFDSFLNPTPKTVIFTMDSFLKNEEDLEDVRQINPTDLYAIYIDYTLVKYAFGKDSMIKSEAIVDNIRVEGLEELKKANLQFNVVNSIPLDFEMQVEFLKDNETRNDIKFTFEGDIKGGSIETPSINPIYAILESETSLEFDAVKVYLVSRASEQQVVLNTEQYVQLTDINVKLPEGTTISMVNNNIL